MSWDLFQTPGVVIQGDGSRFAWLNCAAATAAMHIISERQGKRAAKGSPWPPTGASFRLATGDTEGGLLASQVDATSRRVYVVDPDFRVATSAVVEAKLRAGYGLSYLHSYGPISDAGLSGSPGFRGNHSSFVSAVRDGPYKAAKSCDPLYDGRRPGVPRGPQWVPWASWVRAGELLVIGANGERMIDRYGRDHLYVGFTRIPYRPAAPVREVRYSVAFGGPAFYTYDVAGNQITRRHARQFSKPTSARCGAPAVYPWPGNVSRRLVLMTTGTLKGSYVAVEQGGAHLLETEVKAA